MGRNFQVFLRRAHTLGILMATFGAFRALAAPDLDTARQQFKAGQYTDCAATCRAAITRDRSPSPQSGTAAANSSGRLLMRSQVPRPPRD